MKENNENLFWLNDTRLMAATAIIFVHFVQNVQTTLDAHVGSLAWWVTNFYLSFTMWGVPVFVMISGALLLSNERTYKDMGEFYSKRLKRLGIPILFWTCFYIVITYLKSKLLGHTFEFKTMAIELIGGRPYNHMWYLYMVFGLYVFTPYLRTITRYSSEKEIFILVVMLMTLSFLGVLTHNIHLHYSTIFIFMFPAYLAYFFAGHLILRTSYHIHTRYLLLAIGFFGFLTALGQYAYNIYGWDISFHHNFSFTMIPLSLSIMFFIKNIHTKIKIAESLRNKLATFTLGAYLIHPVLVGIVVKMEYMGLDMHTFTFVKIFIITVCIIVISLIIAYIFSKIPLLKKVI